MICPQSHTSLLVKLALVSYLLTSNPLPLPSTALSVSWSLKTYSCRIPRGTKEKTVQLGEIYICFQLFPFPLCLAGTTPSLHSTDTGREGDGVEAIWQVFQSHHLPPSSLCLTAILGAEVTWSCLETSPGERLRGSHSQDYLGRSGWFNVRTSVFSSVTQSFPGGTSGKEPACQRRRQKRLGFGPWVGKMPWRRAWQHIPVFLPGESHGQRSYSP